MVSFQINLDFYDYVNSILYIGESNVVGGKIVHLNRNDPNNMNTAIIRNFQHGELQIGCFIQVYLGATQ